MRTVRQYPSTYNPQGHRTRPSLITMYVLLLRAIKATIAMSILLNTVQSTRNLVDCGRMGKEEEDIKDTEGAARISTVLSSTCNLNAL